MLEKVILGLIAAGAISLIYFRYFSNNLYRHLFELEEVFDNELDFIQLSKNVLAKMVEVTSASGGLLYWYDEIQKEYKLKTLQGVSVEEINQITKLLRKPDGVFTQLENQFHSFSVISSSKNESNKADFPPMLAIPLKTTQKIYGVIILLNENSKISFKNLNLVDIFAPRSGVHLEKARLYQVTKETAIENARLYLNLSKLYQQATSDELTGLFNRNFLLQRLKEEIKKAWRYKQPLSIIFADIDFFKTVNDQHGHQVGDRLLTEFGTLLKNSVREYDVACRFGGEEFVILLPHTKLENACELAERLRQKTEAYRFCMPEYELTITSSFGVTAIPEITDTPMLTNEDINEYMEKLIDTADKALYSAKRSGRNAVRSSIYKPAKKTKKQVYSANNCRG